MAERPAARRRRGRIGWARSRPPRKRSRPDSASRIDGRPLLDQELVERLWEGVARLRSSLADRFLVMIQRRPPEREPGAAGEVTELSPEEHARARDVSVREGRGGDEALARQVLARDGRIEAAVPTRYFGVSSGGEAVAYASLYLDGEVAQIEDVETPASHRGGGYASAVVLRAVAEARATGAETVYLATSENDWPQHLYRRLGFDAVAVEVMFGRGS